MKYFFESKEKRQELWECLQTWLGTPYRHCAGVKGLGCDCLQMVFKVLEEVGADPFSRDARPCVSTKFGHYTKDYHFHNDDERLVKFIREKMGAEEAPLSPPMDGDIYLFRYGRICSHIAIYSRGCFYHAVAGKKVHKLAFHEPSWHHRKRHNFRILGK